MNCSVDNCTSGNSSNTLNFAIGSHFLPTNIVLGIIALFGILGNPMVVYIFYKKNKREKSSSGLFIIIMGVVDCVASVFIIPYTILMTAFRMPTVTIIFYFFIVSWNLFYTMFLCVTVAVDRYLAVCKPLLFLLTYERAKILSFVNVLSSLAMNLVATIPPANEYFTLYKINLILFICTVVTVFVLYTLVWISIHNRMRKKVGFQTDNTTHVGTAVTVDGGSSNNAPISALTTSKKPVTDATNTNNATRDVTAENKANKKKAETFRTALMLFMITLVFIVSWIPIILLHTTGTFMAELTPLTFLYNIANPVIYYFLNKRFATEVNQIFKKLMCS